MKEKEKNKECHKMVLLGILILDIVVHQKRNKIQWIRLHYS